jgi:hypothetical protein
MFELLRYLRRQFLRKIAPVVNERFTLPDLRRQARQR